MTARGEMTTPRRQIVAYFDHEFISPSTKKLDADISEMIEVGFTNTVLCVTETDIHHRERQAYLKDAVAHMQGEGLEVWADPWAVGGVFGGEAVSHFVDRGETRCDCNDKLEPLLDRWLDTVVGLEIKTVFWDEPEMHCEPHRKDELRFLEKYTRKAGELALDNVVCLCANRAKKYLLNEVVALPDVIEIATDPYYPNAFEKIAETHRSRYVADWAEYTKAVADAHRKRSHLWVQNFDISEGEEHIIGEHIAIATTKNIDVAVWGFHGCESIPGFFKPTNALPTRLWQAAVRALSTKDTMQEA